MTTRGHRGTFEVDGNVLHIDCGDGHTGVYICQMHQITHFNCVHFTVGKL